MKEYEQEMINVLSALNEADALKHVVIAGSWSMYFYRYIFDNFVPRTETTDLDLYLPNPKRATGNDFSSKMSKYSYRRVNDYLTGKTRFRSESGFSIEFLTTPDRTMSSTISVPGLNIVAEALPKMAPAGWNYIQVIFNGLTVNVVSPVSFVLQKLLINKDRKDKYKKIKDLDAIRYVLSFVKLSQKYSLELEESLKTYPKKWKKIIEETAAENGIEL